MNSPCLASRVTKVHLIERVKSSSCKSKAEQTFLVELYLPVVMQTAQARCPAGVHPRYCLAMNVSICFKDSGSKPQKPTLTVIL